MGHRMQRIIFMDLVNKHGRNLPGYTGKAAAKVMLDEGELCSVWHVL